MPTPNMLTATSIIPTLLVSTRVAVTTESTVYTVPSNTAVKLAQGSLANVSVSTITVGLSLVPSGGTADGTHKIIPDTFVLAAGDTLPLGPYIVDHMLGQGDFISIHAGAANAVVVILSGTVIA